VTTLTPTPDAYGPTCKVFRITNDDDVRVLVTSGMAWLSGPRTRIRLTTWLIEHTEVSLDQCWRMHDGLRAYVTAARQ
jgi:hypothetical protein